MLEHLTELSAPFLDLNAYKSDFQYHFWKSDITWKLERQLTFKEPASPSWRAMAEGDWETALRLAEKMRAGRAEHQRELDRYGIVQRRIRFVDEPPTAYLQWELHLLMIWAELGEQIRVLPVENLAHVETQAELPEVLVLGQDVPSPVMYVIQYTDGVLSGAHKHSDTRLIDACRREIAARWQRGENILNYFPKKIAHLPPPTPQGV
jgi:hypothetical protein